MTKGPDTYTRLRDSLIGHMRMSHVYQPVMLKVLLNGNGKASLRAIAAAFLIHGSRRAGLAFLAAACLVTFSRIYIGTHYASDVLGGALTGVFAAFIVRAVYREVTRADRLITSIL